MEDLVLGKGDRRIWTRYTDLEPSAGKITQILRAAESIGGWLERHWFKEDQEEEEGTVSPSLYLYFLSRDAKDWEIKKQMEITIWWRDEQACLISRVGEYWILNFQMTIWWWEVGDYCKEKSLKFLGHLLDENLTRVYHADHVHKKLASANFALCWVSRSKSSQKIL